MPESNDEGAVVIREGIVLDEMKPLGTVRATVCSTLALPAPSERRPRIGRPCFFATFAPRS
jgi:hypothetical protein